MQGHRLALGAAAPEHAHTLEDQVLYVPEGEPAPPEGGRERRLATGGCALLRRSVPHSWRALSPARLLVVVVPGPSRDFGFDVGEPVDDAAGADPAALPEDLPERLSEQGVVLVAVPAP